ncbi:ankyrin repeat-containing domain protein [Mycena epipterygia]|nr:ankyrin repeat-containing domain protein [Mycena epipterygia]
MSGESQIVNNYIYGGQGGSGGGGGIQGGCGGAGEGPAVTHHINVAGNFTMNSLYPEQPEGYHNSTERDKIIEWYSPLNFFLRQADIFAARQPGTVGWLLESDLFRKWKSAGAGKTVLVSIVVDHLRTAQDCENIGVAAINLNHKGSDAQSPTSLLASLWRQLVFGKSISPLVRELHTKHTEWRTRPSVEEAHAVLCSIISEYSMVFVLVDALDEYPEATEEDIRKYLDQQILNSSSLSKHISKAANLRETIEEKVVQSSDGMFLLAKLHIDSLTTSLTIREVRDALKNMPNDFDRKYDEIVDRIDRQLDKYKAIAWSTLSWITNTKRPLHSSELREALAIEPGAKELDPETLLDMDTILSVCTGLVVLNEGDDIIRLIHYTTQNYFELAHVQARLFPHAQTTITTTCITYLSFPVLLDSTDDWNHYEKHSFLDYAVQYALIHARGQPESDIRDMILWFLGNCSAWRRLWDSWSWNTFRTGDMPEEDAQLGIAAFFGLDEIVQYLIKEDGSGPGLQPAIAEWSANDVDLREGSKREVYDWALWAATLAGHEIIVGLLLEHGAYVNAEEDGCSILWEASKNGHKAIVKLLIGHCADLNAVGQSGSALWVALEKGHEAISKSLIEHGADANSRNKWQESVLQTESAQGHEAIVKLLIEHGANINAENEWQESALQAASEKGHEAVVKLLIEHGADINAQNQRWGSALWAASKNGHEAVAKLLIEHGANINAGGWNRSALRAASENGHEAIVKLLVAHNASINPENERQSALQEASENGHEAIVKLLIAHGADVNAGGWNRSALWEASENGHEVVAQLLIAHGANVNAQNPSWGSALWAASMNGHEVVAKLLIEHGADINVVGWLGSALQAASENGHEAIVKLLIEHGADVNALGGGPERSALCVASENGHDVIVKLLIEHGADVNAGGWEGSAFLAASKNGHEAVAKLLIEHGADINGGGWQGSVLWEASKKGHKAVVKLLTAHGEDSDRTKGNDEMRAGYDHARRQEFETTTPMARIE